MDDMMARAGLRNLAGTLGDKQLAHVDLEAIVAAKPDYIIFTHDQSNVRDWGAMLLRHRRWSTRSRPQPPCPRQSDGSAAARPIRSPSRGWPSRSAATR